MNFENQIQQWVSLDNQLKKLSEQTKELRDKRNTISDDITSYVNSHNMTNSVVQISDGKIKFANTRVPEPLTFKYLEKTLAEIIKNESQVKLIVEHLKQKRIVKNIPELKRIYNN